MKLLADVLAFLVIVLGACVAGTLLAGGSAHKNPGTYQAVSLAVGAGLYGVYLVALRPQIGKRRSSQRAEPEEPPREGTCPKCGFRHGWDGTGCKHCGFIRTTRKAEPEGIIRWSCRACGAKLKTTEAVKAGEQVECPKCGADSPVHL